MSRKIHEIVIATEMFKHSSPWVLEKRNKVLRLILNNDEGSRVSNVAVAGCDLKQLIAGPQHARIREKETIR